ncbi:hypothetical protein BRADI_5g06903v3 [Brachypodium distachyon]|uniref:Uncharacterized protein n=1 Tax=Brachypodium distachyon TaxID=15368 RepID=A0A0Q3E3E0_BRADI|nr:hypothetical protein BRADI_5g06903v3 [Brachypodium distachyon]
MIAAPRPLHRAAAPHLHAATTLSARCTTPRHTTATCRATAASDPCSSPATSPRTAHTDSPRPTAPKLEALILIVGATLWRHTTGSPPAKRTPDDGSRRTQQELETPVFQATYALATNATPMNGFSLLIAGT